MKHLLKKCGKQEDSLKIYDSQQALLNEFYFTYKQLAGLNKSTTALNTSYFVHYVNLLGPIIEHALMHAGLRQFIMYLQNNQIPEHDKHGKKTCKDKCNKHHAQKHKKCNHPHGQESRPHENKACKHKKQNQKPHTCDGNCFQDFAPSGGVAYYAFTTAHLAMHMPVFYEMLVHARERAHRIVDTQANIAHLKSYLENVRSLYTELATIAPEFAAEHAPTLTRMFSENANDTLSATTMKLLRSSWKSTFQNTFNPGSILAMYTELTIHAAEIKNVAQEVGVIDAYVNIAHAMLTHTNKYCFVTFDHNAQPVLNIQGLWHHAIAADKMRPLRATLDNEKSCLVMCGANGSGKSTLDCSRPGALLSSIMGYCTRKRYEPYTICSYLYPLIKA